MPRLSMIMPSLEANGAERTNVALAREFRAAGVDVEFVVMRGGGDLTGEAKAIGTVVELNARRLRNAFAPLVRNLRRRQPDAVLGSMWPLSGLAIVAARIAASGARIVVSEHTNWMTSPRTEGAALTALRLCGRGIFSMADAVVCVSDGAKSALAKATGLSPAKIATIYNAVPAPPAEAELDENPLATWWCEAEPRLLSIGRLVEEKDYPTLLAAFRALDTPGARLLILGEGARRGELEWLIDHHELGARVRLGGFKADVHPWLSRASLFVLSSKCEGLGNVLIEALAHGLPIVSTDCPSGPSEVLMDGKYGSLTPVGDSRALSAAIARVLHMEVDAEAQKARARNFLPSVVAPQYLDLLFPGEHARAANPR